MGEGEGEEEEGATDVDSGVGSSVGGSVEGSGLSSTWKLMMMVELASTVVYDMLPLSIASIRGTRAGR